MESPSHEKISHRKHRDWIAISVATVSFVISLISFALTATTTYYSVLRVQDDVRLVSTEVPAVLYDSANKKLTVSRSESLLFINAGSRAVSINRVYLNVEQPLDGKPLSATGCNGNRLSMEVYDAEPFVIKAGEMEPKKMQLVSPVEGENGKYIDATLDEKPRVDISLSKDNEGKSKVKFKLCLLVDLTTIDTDYSGITAELITDEIDDAVMGYAYFSDTGVRPLQLIKKSKVIFFD
jgi:hypothetical protein